MEPGSAGRRPCTGSCNAADDLLRSSVASRITRHFQIAYFPTMNWKSIRLELGPTAGFPKGSASRAFVLCAPLDELGMVDHQAVARDPRRATVRRFWASEADEFGRLEYVDGSWIFRVRRGKGEEAYRFAAGPFQLDAVVNVQGPDGTTVPFRVARKGSLSRFAAAAE